MNRISRTIISICLFALLSVGVTSATAGECSAIVQRALTMVEDTCAGTGRNQACHGYTHVDAEPREPDQSFRFDLGDIVDLAGIQSLRTQPLNLESGEWGVAFLRVQANLPDALPGSNVTYLLFGDAEIGDRGESSISRPMQAIRLRTGITGVSCEDAPLDGLLIQTPDDAVRVTLNINDVPVSLGSTVLFQAETDNSLTVTTLEGSAHLIVHGVELTVLPGESLRIATGDSNIVQSMPYDAMGVDQLPLELLDEPVLVPGEGGLSEGGAGAQDASPTANAPLEAASDGEAAIDWCQPGNPVGGTSPWSGQPGGRSAWEAANCPQSPGTGVGNSGGTGGGNNSGGSNGSGGGGGGSGNSGGNGNGGANGNGGGNGNSGGNGNGNGNGGGNGGGNGNGKISMPAGDDVPYTLVVDLLR